MSKITFVIFTFNEEKRIERVINNFRNFGNILIVDNYSTDNTLDIANKYGCETLLNKNEGWVEDSITVGRVKNVVKTDWIYWGFADEMVDFLTLKNIVEIVESKKYDIINITRKNYYYGRFCEEAFADRMNRIFTRDSIDFNGNKIHNFGKPTVPTSRIFYFPKNFFIHHFISNTAKSYLASIDRYTDIEATENRQWSGCFNLILAPGRIFMKNFILRGGYKGGVPVLLLVCQMVIYRWMSIIKTYESFKNINRISIEKNNDAIRDDILKSFK